MIATGVASPSAQGHEITSTQMPRSSAAAGDSPAISHPSVTASAMAITAGTNTPDTLSATLAIGALVAAAFATSSIICESVVSSPTLSALHLSIPSLFIVAALTLSPSVLSTGMLSPVRADSSTAPAPSVTTPSTGMLSPGRTMKISPTDTSSVITSVSTPSLITTAVFGESFNRLFSASVVRPLDIASSILPTVMRAGIMAADSK